MGENICKEEKIFAKWKKREPSYTVGGNAHWYSHYGEHYGGYLKNQNRATIWPSNPTPRHVSGKKHNSKRYMHPVFIATLLTIAKTWKQPKCPLTDEWIKKMWYIYTMEYYSAIKKNEIMPFAATWMDIEIIILSEVSQTKANIIWYHLYVESKKLIQMNLFTKQKQTHRLRNQTYSYQRGKVRGRDKLGGWD